MKRDLAAALRGPARRSSRNSLKTFDSAVRFGVGKNPTRRAFQNRRIVFGRSCGETEKTDQMLQLRNRTNGGIPRGARDRALAGLQYETKLPGSSNFGGLVLGCIDTDFCKRLLRFLQIFRRLVLGWINSYDSNQILIFQVFRDLQDFHTFAPLISQNFSKKVVTVLSFLKNLNNLNNWNIFEKFEQFKIS